MSAPIAAGVLRPLHVFESYAPVPSGYAERSRELIEGMAALSGVDPIGLVTSRQLVYGEGRVASRPGGPQLTLLKPTVRERGVRKARRFFVDGRALRREIEDAATAHSADLIHVHWSSTIGSASAEAARALGLPLVAEVRFDLAGAVSSQSLRWQSAWLERRLRRRFESHLAAADLVIAASEPLAELLRRELPAVAPRLQIVRNGVDTSRFFPAEASRQMRERLGYRGVPIVGSTAKMLRYEGLAELLGGVAELRSRGVAVDCALAGDGPELPGLRRLVGALGLEVRFLGRLGPDEVPDFLRALDVFCVPRRRLTVTEHAGPLKVLEAMACGRAVLATAVGESTELLADGRGELVSDPGAPLIEALAGLAATPERREALGAAAANHVRRKRGWGVSVNRSLDLYRDLLSGAPRRPPIPAARGRARYGVRS